MRPRRRFGRTQTAYSSPDKTAFLTRIALPYPGKTEFLTMRCPRRPPLRASRPARGSGAPACWTAWRFFPRPAAGFSTYAAPVRGGHCGHASLTCGFVGGAGRRASAGPVRPSGCGKIFDLWPHKLKILPRSAVFPVAGAEAGGGRARQGRDAIGGRAGAAACRAGQPRDRTPAALAPAGQKFRFAEGGKRRRPLPWSEIPFCGG